VIDSIDLFDIYQHGKLAQIGALQADSSRRVTDTGERLLALEQRYERMRLVNAALWQLLNEAPQGRRRIRGHVIRLTRGSTEAQSLLAW
jgi:hypothetical protein